MKEMLNKILKDLIESLDNNIKKWEDCSDEPFPIKVKKEDDTFEKGFDKGYHEGIGYAIIKVNFLLSSVNKELDEYFINKRKNYVSK